MGDLDLALRLGPPSPTKEALDRELSTFLFSFVNRIRQLMQEHSNRPGWAATLLLEVKNRKLSFVRQGPRAVHLWCSSHGERDAGKWGPLTCSHFHFKSQIGFPIGAQQKGAKPIEGEADLTLRPSLSASL
ncbi:hypothetical protein KY284_022283 [Solanum tuberosum]|nr:hypothetical protein KY284_022283 [Solanum tuberosum]